MATLAIGLVLRILVTYSVVFGNKLNVKEKIFIALSWLPKATVQVSLIFFWALTIRDGKIFLFSGTIENIEKNFCEKIEKNVT